MRKVLFLIIGLLLPSGVSLGQVGKPAAVQVRRCERTGSGFDAITEANYELTRIAAKPDDVAVVRVCSREPMPLALSIAAMNPFTVARALNQGYNFALERILFLRSEDCLGPDSAVAATELWAVPKGAALPTFVESIKSNQAHLETVGTKLSWREHEKLQIGYKRTHREGASSTGSNRRGCGLLLQTTKP